MHISFANEEHLQCSKFSLSRISPNVTIVAMARHSKSQKNMVRNGKATGPSSDSKANKTRSMDEILGISAMEIEQVTRTEEEDLREIQQSQQTHRLFSEWLSSIHSIDGNDV